jgi:hypothetical protein
MPIIIVVTQIQNVYEPALAFLCRGLEASVSVNGIFVFDPDFLIAFHGNGFYFCCLFVSSCCSAYFLFCLSKY